MLLPVGGEAPKDKEVGMLDPESIVTEGVLEKSLCGKSRLLVHKRAIHHEERLGWHATCGSHSSDKIGIRKVKNLHQLRKCIPKDRGVDTPSGSSELIPVFGFSTGLNCVSAKPFFKSATYREDGVPDGFCLQTAVVLPPMELILNVDGGRGGRRHRTQLIGSGQYNPTDQCLDRPIVFDKAG